MSRNKVTRKNPAFIMLVVDKSGSMAEKLTFNGKIMSKSHAVSIIINSFIDELLFRCRRGGDYMNYFEVALFGYNEQGCYSLFEYLDSSKNIFTVSDLIGMEVGKYSISRRRIGNDGRYFTHTTKINSWIDDSCSGKTPMKTALQTLYEFSKKWISKSKGNISPILINISDGQATDANDPELILLADKIKKLSIAGENVLFMNVNISSMQNESIIFPTSTVELPEGNTFAKLLYDMSSTLPEEFAESLNYLKDDELSQFDSSVPCRAMAYNASLNDLLGILSIGTSTITG